MDIQKTGLDLAAPDFSVLRVENPISLQGLLPSLPVFLKHSLGVRSTCHNLDCEGQRATCRSWLPPTAWVPGMQLRQFGLVTTGLSGAPSVVYGFYSFSSAVSFLLWLSPLSLPLRSVPSPLSSLNLTFVAIVRTSLSLASQLSFHSFPQAPRDSSGREGPSLPETPPSLPAGTADRGHHWP